MSRTGFEAFAEPSRTIDPLACVRLCDTFTRLADALKWCGDIPFLQGKRQLIKPEHKEVIVSESLCHWYLTGHRVLMLVKQKRVVAPAPRRDGGH